MKRIAYTLVVALAAARTLAAQDSAAAPTPAPAQAPAPAPTLTVTEAVIARSVVDRAPQDTGSTFPATVGQLVCWTKVAGATGEMTVHHVWFHGETQVGDIELHLGGSPWRTWSRKTVPADWTGPWHVEVRDAAGAVLKRLDLTVGP